MNESPLDDSDGKCKIKISLLKINKLRNGTLLLALII